MLRLKFKPLSCWFSFVTTTFVTLANACGVNHRRASSRVPTHFLIIVFLFGKWEFDDSRGLLNASIFTQHANLPARLLEVAAHIRQCDGTEARRLDATGDK